MLSELLAEHRPGHALPQAFHVGPEVHALELERIWRRSWLFACVSGQLPETGDFVRLAVGDDGIIVVRDGDGRLHALHDTCRHRGTPVCPGDSGRVARWVCPYHQWSYALDGRLLGCGGMDAEVEPDELGLRCAAVVEVGGLVFVWPGPDAEPFDPRAARELAYALSPQGLARAKVAHQIDYTVAAGWKLIWENNRECWHCHLGHPEYNRANFDAAPDTDRTRELARSRAGDHAQALGTLPAPEVHAAPGLYAFPTPGRWWSVNRTPLAPGFVTESHDGQAVATLMGDYADADVGVLRVRAVPNFWGHASSDHGVLTRLLPLGPQSTQIRVQWLVDRDAVEGHDYELARLLPLWQLTSEQDWALCEANQSGVRSPAYTPGPLSRTREYNVASFIDWYLQRIA